MDQRILSTDERTQCIVDVQSAGIPQVGSPLASTSTPSSAAGLSPRGASATRGASTAAPTTASTGSSRIQIVGNVNVKLKRRLAQVFSTSLKILTIHLKLAPTGSNVILDLVFQQHVGPPRLLVAD